MADVLVHNWSDVAYLGLLVILAIVGAWRERKVSAKADNVETAVVDVKRAVGLVKRAEDPPIPDGRTRPRGERRHTDPPAGSTND